MKYSIVVFLFLIFLGGQLGAVPSNCTTCHQKHMPRLVKDFQQSEMSKSLSCIDCHGEQHQTAQDADKAQIPTLEICQNCHGEQVDHFLQGKHGRSPIDFTKTDGTHLPFAQAGAENCSGCHTSMNPKNISCQNCHSRHLFSKKEAQQPEVCQKCHGNGGEVSWQAWLSSAHGIIYRADRVAAAQHIKRTADCQTCHMDDGDHRVRTSGILWTLDLPAKDKSWRKYREKINLFFNKSGKSPDYSRFIRQEYRKVCRDCHSSRFMERSFKRAYQFMKEADALAFSAITIAGGHNPHYATLQGNIKHPRIHSKALLDILITDRKLVYSAANHMNFQMAVNQGLMNMRRDVNDLKDQLSRETE